MIETKISRIISEVIRILGPTIVRNLFGQGRIGKNDGPIRNDDNDDDDDEGSRVTVASPYDDEEVQDDNENENNETNVFISFPTYPPDEDNAMDTNKSTTVTVSSMIMTESTTLSLTSNGFTNQ
ncbi:hypothetical protein PV326_001934, partial [Microctonus aethiopoides]